MATTKQKEAARKNLEKARRVKGKSDQSRSGTAGLSTASKDRLGDTAFAFPDERKEPLADASHVRNAIARFDQVTGVSDAERDRAWKRIQAAAKKYDVDISVDDWRDLAHGGKS
jgi:hypothetical protein